LTPLERRALNVSFVAQAAAVLQVLVWSNTLSVYPLLQYRQVEAAAFFAFKLCFEYYRPGFRPNPHNWRKQEQLHNRSDLSRLLPHSYFLRLSKVLC
jgi:hypothetical protein